MSVADDTGGIAIIGMACRFPGADSPTTFWNNLCQGVESITFFSEAELLAAGVEAALLQDPNYVKASPVLHDIETFDAPFFAYSPREAALIDPQQRLFLEVAWEAFEDAGYHPEAPADVTGVFAGSGGILTTYLLAHYSQHPELAGQTGGLQHMGNDKDFLSTRVSYKLNLTGPSLNVQTACSTSLVAVHLACQSLRGGECDMALAGASTVRIPHIRGYAVEPGNIHSVDGHCRPFDAQAQGTIFGSGVGAVVLKRVPDAVADGDHIYAIIKSTAMNNDGGMKVSYTASSVVGQARAMVEALTLADVAPDTLSYVECHGTATAVGDPLELQALTRAFRTQTSSTGFCAIGSVKSNVGHLEQTAGMASLIKTALALHYKRLVPSLHFTTPNPKIDFDHSPFYVNTSLCEWPAGLTPRRAAVNALGLGGTNVFAVLQEAPPLPPVPAAAERPLHLCNISAKSDAALLSLAERLLAFLEAYPDVSLADVLYTTSVSRTAFAHRFSVLTDSAADARHKLAAFVSGTAGTAVSSSRERQRPLAFLFTGQGSQYTGMAAELYQTQPVFRETMQRCDALARPLLGRSLLEVVFTPGEDATLLHDTAYTQPALFAVEYALAQLWRAWGVLPGAVLGHSVGEFVAACVAGVFTLQDALELVTARGQLMQALPRQGAMVVVGASEAVMQEALAPYRDCLSIAAVNSPQNTVISGSREAMTDVLQTLHRQALRTTELTVSHAFHSPLMDPMLAEFARLAQHYESKTPCLPLVSNVTGTLLEQAPDAQYWCTHARQAVRFADGLQTLHTLGYEAFLEIGPGTTLLGLGQQCLPQAHAMLLPSLKPQQSDWYSLLESLRQLYLAGWSINWPAVEQGFVRRRLALPTYPFQRQRYWLDAVPGGDTPLHRRPTPSTHPLLGARLRSGLKEVQFEALYSVEHLPYLSDHRIYGLVVLPTTAGLEVALAAGKVHFGSANLQIENLVYHEALVLPEEQSRVVQCVLTPQNSAQVAFQLLSSDLDTQDTWRQHLSGVLRSSSTTQASPTSFAATEVHARCPGEIPPARYYAALRTLGLAYGPSFQGIQQLWQGHGETLSKVCLPPHLAPEPYGIHPALLDACLHVYPALVEAYGDFTGPSGPSEQTYLPIALERFRVYQDAPTVLWTHAVRRAHGAGDPGTLVLDMRLYDEAGSLVAAFDGLSLRRIAPQALQPATHAAVTDWLYHLHWEERPALALPQPVGASQPTSWLIFADRGGLGDTLATLLEQRGDECYVVVVGPALAQDAGRRWSLNPARREDFQKLLQAVFATLQQPCRGILYCWGMDVPALQEMTLEQLDSTETLSTGGALYLIQTCAEARSADGTAARLWCITRNAQRPLPDASPNAAAQATLWGLARTVPLEHPSIWGGLIDLPATGEASQDAAAIIAELLSPDGEEQVALRLGKRFVPRFVRGPKARQPALPLRFRADATYLITGGLGTLGRKVATWLVEQQNARHLVLTGRRGAQGAALDTIKALEARGATVHVAAADITVEAELARVLTEIQQQLPPLKGVIHCAGLLDDGVLSQLDWAKFTRVTAPKIRGGWLLHQATRDLTLDVFIVFSSILSLTGSAGQANYTAANAFLDALMEYRQALGLPGMAINWGPWDEAGLATASGARGEAIWRSRGTRYIPPEGGMQVFAYLVQQNVEHAAVSITDWSLYLEQFAAPPPFYAVLAREVGPLRRPQRSSGPQNVRARLDAVPSQERRSIVADSVHEQVQQVLGFDGALDPRQPLNELGLDSLLSVNLVTRLEAVLGVAVPVVKLIQGPSLEQLVDELCRDLMPAMAEPVAPARIRTPETAANAWLVWPRPNATARIRLFCFPFAGGGAATYRSWAEALSPSIEIVAVEPPGRASRIHEPPISDLGMFLDQLVPAMRPYLDKPFAFFGHCLGALTAFETARRLLSAHQLQATHFFASGARAPHRLQLEGPFEEKLLDRLLTHSAFDPFLWPYEQPDTVFADIIRHFNIGATEDLLHDAELQRLMLPAIRAEFAMTLRYHYTPEPPWDTPITCFTGRDDAYVTRADVMEWGRYTDVAFRVYMREGAHFIVVDDKSFILQCINHELSA